MRKILRILFIVSAALILSKCSKEYEVPNDLVLRDFAWKGLNAYYLYQDEIDDLSDRRFNSDQELNTYLNTFTNELDLFSSLLIAGDTKSILVPDYNIGLEDIPLRTAFTNGLEFGIIADPNSIDNVLAYVTHILPASDASTKTITRGNFFNVVDGTQLTRDNYEDVLINGADTFTLEMVDFNGTTITPNATTISLTKNTYNYPAVFLEDIIIDSGNTIGYLAYNNDFSTNYINDINNTFSQFKSQNINKLILDLRYNIGSGSFAKNISQIASMITGRFTDKTLIKEEWNAKAQPWFLANQPDSLLTKFPAMLNATTTIESVNVTDVYIVLNGLNFTGSSAIELLINSLNAHINVHLIGNQTIGNNTGAITLYNSDDYNFALRNESHTVALEPIVLSFLNNNDETYENGFTPNIILCPNEDILNLGTLGDASDPILNEVLMYISTGSPGIVPTCNINNFEYLYNSINPQREIDHGVFIKQQLPNTN